MRRRDFLGSGLTGTALAANGVAMHDQARAASDRSRVDLEDPVENVRVFTRISADLATICRGRVHYSGKAFGILEDGAVVPFYGIEGMGMTSRKVAGVESVPPAVAAYARRHLGA